MNLLVIIDDFGQDTSLGGAIEGTMTEKEWLSDDSFTFAFKKTVSEDISANDIEAQIKADVDAATLEAEWKDVKYLFVIGNHSPKFAVSKGD